LEGSLLINLDKQAEVYLEMFKNLPAIHSMNPHSVRELFSQVESEDIALELINKVEDWTISVNNDDDIKIRVYTPEGQGPFPIFVYYHGGGWVIGDLETADATCRMIANQINHLVVSVDYRLSPEYKFPVPVEDSYAALQWVSKNALKINGTTANLVVGGDSAGGNLAAVMTLLARNNNGPDIAAQVLIYPATDLNFNTASYEKYAKGFGLDKDLMKWFRNHYLNDEEDQLNVYASPLMAHYLSDLPPALVITAEHDVLRDEGFAYAERLRNSGVYVEYKCEPGLVHGYFTNMSIFSERIKDSISQIESFLKKINHNIYN